MRNMKGKTESVQLGLEILTPVQAGSGANLSRNLDYIDHAGKVFVVDQERTFEAIAAGDAVLAAVLSAASLNDLVGLAGQRFGYALPSLSGQDVIPEKEFREQLKDAFLKPYVPGTALKGAIRTVLFATALRKLPETTYQEDLPRWDNRNNKPSTSAKMAAKKLTDNLFGKDPNHDLLRALHVGDALFQTEDLRLADIRWLNLTGKSEPYRPRWRDMPTRTSKDRWQEATGLHAETLAPQAVAPVTLQWDGFLLGNLKWHGDHPIPNLLPRTFDELRDRLNGHAKYRLEREIAFYRQYGQDKARSECERLMGLIGKETDAAYLQLSWGSGWRGMTGDWMSDGIKKTMRGRYREMKGCDGMPFPKTRRLAVANNHPSLPLGWVRLIPFAQAAERLQKIADNQRQQVSRCPWVDETVARIMTEHRAKEDDALRGKALAEAWSQIGDETTKKAALADIKSRWQAKDWWDSNLSGAAKKARAIYQQGDQSAG